MLFLPFAAVVFAWCRQLYGTRAAWLALALMLGEPTIAAHVAPAALDVLAMESAVIACYFGWRHFERPTTSSMIAAGMALAAAMLVKHTNLVLPIAFAAYALLVTERPWRRRVNEFLAVLLVTVISIWVFCGFDFSMPKLYADLLPATYEQRWGFASDVLNPILEHRWPAGIYIGSLFGGLAHGREGHAAFLLGQYGARGWWYYVPVVAAYKVPVGVMVVMPLALVSLRWVKPRREELALLIPFALLLGLLMISRLSIGFRHALPAYAFLLMLASRAAAAGVPIVPAVLAWLCAAAAALHGLTFHPDYIAYINFPRRDVELQISDSNLDWGQSLQEVRAWLDAHPQSRPVHVLPFADPFSRAPRWYLGAGVDILAPGDPPPTSGLLILSPVHEAGPYDPSRPYRFLWHRAPDAIIGRTMRAYDLDRMHSED
jgi:hypothetical protein